MITIPIIDYVAKLGTNRSKAGQLLQSPNAALRPATTRSGIPMPATACARRRRQHHLGYADRRQCRANDNLLERGWIAASRDALGASPSTAAFATTSSTTSPRSGIRRIATCTRRAPAWTRFVTKWITCAREVKNADPARSSWRRRVGLARHEACQRLRPVVRQHSRLDRLGRCLPDRSSHGQMDYLPWLLQQMQQQDNVRPGRRLRRRAHRALLPAGRRVQQRHLVDACRHDGTSRRDRCGIRATWTTAGSRQSSAASRSCATG